MKFKLAQNVTAVIAGLALAAVVVHGNDEPRKKTITFKKGAVVEMAYLSVKEGKQGQLQDYFIKVTPIATQDYQAEPLGSFPVMKMERKGKVLSAQPHMVGFFQWPDVEAFLRLHEDPRFLAVVPGRDDALSYLKNGDFYVVEEDVSLTVHEDRVYEIFAGPSRHDAGREHARLRKLERDAGKYEAAALKLYPLSGATRHAVLNACTPEDDDYVPETIVISEWPSLEAASSVDDERKRAHRRFASFFGPYGFPPKE